MFILYRFDLYTHTALTHHSHTHRSHTMTTALTLCPPNGMKALPPAHLPGAQNWNPLSHKGLRGNRGAGLRPTVKGAALESWEGLGPQDAFKKDSRGLSCLENSMDRGAWQVTVHGVAKSTLVTEWVPVLGSWETCRRQSLHAIW